MYHVINPMSTDFILFLFYSRVESAAAVNLFLVKANKCSGSDTDRVWYRYETQRYRVANKDSTAIYS